MRHSLFLYKDDPTRWQSNFVQLLLYDFNEQVCGQNISIIIGWLAFISTKLIISKMRTQMQQLWHNFLRNQYLWKFIPSTETWAPFSCTVVFDSMPANKDPSVQQIRSYHMTCGILMKGQTQKKSTVVVLQSRMACVYKPLIMWHPKIEKHTFTDTDWWRWAHQ